MPTLPALNNTLYNTTALYFYEDGVKAGACNVVYNNDSRIIGLPTTLFASGNFCGQEVFVTNTVTGLK
jgi:hypothetical protein